MIEDLPIWIDLLLLITCLLTIGFFYYSNGKPKRLTIVLILWSVVHSALAYNGFYQNMVAIPPRFGLVLIPSLLFIIYGLLPGQHEWLLKARNTKISTLLHVVRIPVEIVLFALFIYKMIPELMTFEGRNYDIIMGVTAPVIGYLFLKKKIGSKGLLVWNIIGLILILFILLNGILSAEFPFQQFGFEQPNRGILYFPYVLLPALIVPIVIWTHLSDIIILRKKIKLNVTL